MASSVDKVNASCCASNQLAFLLCSKNSTIFRCLVAADAGGVEERHVKDCNSDVYQGELVLTV